jgi:hypothetical protein
VAETLAAGGRRDREGRSESFAAGVNKVGGHRVEVGSPKTTASVSKRLESNQIFVN